MKKTLITISLTAISILFSNLAFAEIGEVCDTNSQCAPDELCARVTNPNTKPCPVDNPTCNILKVCLNRIDVLTGRPGEDSINIINKYPETKTIANLPELTLEAGISDVIKTILGWSMIITIVAIVVASIYYMISRGKDEDITKAKDILIYLIIGMAIMAAAYGIVAGISQFNFFT